MSFQKITSRDNQHVKFAKRVRDGRESGLIFIEGARSVEEAASSGIVSVLVFATPGYFQRPGPDGLIDELGSSADVFEVSESVMDAISDTKTPQGIVLIAKRPTAGANLVRDRMVGNTSYIPLAVYLAGVNNPSNLGAVVRTAEAAGIAGVILSPGSADPYSPRSIRGSMGSAFRVPIWEEADFAEVAKWCSENKISMAGTLLDGSESYIDLDWSVPKVVAFGSEGHGLPDEVTTALDERVRIPMQTPVESLNLAVSCGIILFEARRQRSDP